MEYRLGEVRRELAVTVLCIGAIECRTVTVRVRVSVVSRVEYLIVRLSGPGLKWTDVV